MYTPINRSLEFVSKFPDELKDKTQLQKFLGCLNYDSYFIPNLSTICLPLFKRIRKNLTPRTDSMVKSLTQLKQIVNWLTCLGIPDPNANLIVETDASELEFGGILKQLLPDTNKEQVVRYYSRTLSPTQLNYSTIKKEILVIILCITKFQDDLFSKSFFIKKRL